MEGLDIGRFTGVVFSTVENASVIFDFDEGLPQEELEAALERMETYARKDGWEIDPEQIGKYIRVSPNFGNPDDFTAEIGIQVQSADGNHTDFEFLENVISREEGKVFERIALAYIRAALESYFIRREREQRKAARSA